MISQARALHAKRRPGRQSSRPFACSIRTNGHDSAASTQRPLHTLPARSDIVSKHECGCSLPSLKGRALALTGLSSLPRVSLLAVKSDSVGSRRWRPAPGRKCLVQQLCGRLCLPAHTLRVPEDLKAADRLLPDQGGSRATSSSECRCGAVPLSSVFQGSSLPPPCPAPSPSA